MVKLPKLSVEKAVNCFWKVEPLIRGSFPLVPGSKKDTLTSEFV